VLVVVIVSRCLAIPGRDEALVGLHAGVAGAVRQEVPGLMPGVRSRVTCSGPSEIRAAAQRSVPVEVIRHGGDLGPDGGQGVLAESQPQRRAGQVQRGQHRLGRLVRVAGLGPVHRREPSAGSGGGAVVVGDDGARAQGRAEESGAEHPGLHDQHPDAQRPRLDGECLAGLLQGALGGAVRAGTGQRHEPHHAADLDDGTAAAGPHVRQDQAGQPHGPEEQDVELVAELLLGGLLDGADDPVAGVVDQHVDAPIGGQGRLDGSLALARVAHVQRNRGDPSREVPGQAS
jgi:hypothetical protein